MSELTFSVAPSEFLEDIAATCRDYAYEVDREYEVAMQEEDIDDEELAAIQAEADYARSVSDVLLAENTYGLRGEDHVPYTWSREISVMDYPLRTREWTREEEQS